MPPSWIIEPVDILENRALGLASCFPTVTPDQLRLDGFEERLHHGIVITIAFAAHRDLEAVLFQAPLILIGTILRPAVRVVNQSTAVF